MVLQNLQMPVNYRTKRIDSELKEELESTEKSNESDRYKPQSQQKKKDRKSKNINRTRQRINVPPFAFSLLDSPPIWNIRNICQNPKRTCGIFKDDEGNMLLD